MPFASGATFVGYKVLRILGHDDTGDVYLVQHPRLPYWSALKVLSERLTEDCEFRDRFSRETPIATSLRHPHILGVDHRGESGGRLWITMDFVNGTDAGHIIANRFPDGMPVGGVLSIVTAIADALDYAHSRGMVHRDVKPAKILISSPADGERQILLTDFGIARRLSDCNGGWAPGPTDAAVVYAAPEQLTNADIDGRADQYALAVTAFHLLTGAPPLPQANPVTATSRRLITPPPSLRGRRPDLARLDDTLATALAKNPHDRLHSCRAFADALSNSAGAWTGSVVDYPDDLPAAPPATDGSAPSGAGGATAPAAIRHRRWPWVVGLGSAAAALCVGLLTVGIVIGRGNDAAPRQATGPLAGIRGSAPVTAPTTTNGRDFPGPGEALDGSYRFDVNRAHQTYNSTPDPQPPNVSTRWAFRTSCTPTSCVAVGTLLDDNDHQEVSPTGGHTSLVLDFRDGAWQSRPDKVLFACVVPNGVPGAQTTTQVIRLQQAGGALRGVMMVTVDSDECSQQGAAIEIPAVAAHVGDVPPGVEVPAPPTSTPPAPASTRPTR
jgi:serine/threonine-protein kinase